MFKKFNVWLVVTGTEKILELVGSIAIIFMMFCIGLATLAALYKTAFCNM
jgi:Kef-type K+ transport system membrane component KefB